MKTIYLSLLLSLSISVLFAQNYGNEWINSNQAYLKIETAQAGIYRISAQEISAAGFDLSGVQADFLHLYFRGEEQNIFVKKNASGGLEELEFYAFSLDGKEDAELYREPNLGGKDPSQQAHPSFSLFSDSSAFFLTWDQNLSTHRYENYSNTNYSNSIPERVYRYESRLAYHPNQANSKMIFGGGGPYEPFHSLNPTYGPGEGYWGPFFGNSSPLELLLDTRGASNDTASIEVSTRVFHASRTQHILKLALKQDVPFTLLDTSINTSQILVKTYERKISSPPSLGDSSIISFEALRQPTEYNYFLWVSMKYNRFPNLSGASETIISDWSRNQDAFFEFSQIDGTDSVFVYDVENGIRNAGTILLDTARIIVKGDAGKRNLYVSSDKAVLSPTLSTVSMPVLSGQNNGAEFLIISHESLRPSAESYKLYRESNAVNSLSSQIVYVDQIYEEFGYGVPSPLAIHRFCNYALENWQVAPQYILLWGNAKFEIRNQAENLVPSYGNPVSDHFFTIKLDAPLRDSLIPQIPIGRVNIRNNQEGMNYLNKVIAYEQNADSSWIRRGIFLGGGAGAGEQAAIRNSLESFRTIYDNGSSLRNSYLCLIDSTADPNNTCYAEIDRGVGLIHFFGHSTANIQDIEIGEADTYNNFGRYPVMIAMGCNGADFSKDWSFGERWITAANRGAIAYLGTSAPAYLNPLRDLGKNMYSAFYAGSYPRLGDALLGGIKLTIDSLPGIQYVNHALQFNLQGDPSLLWIPGQSNATSVDEELLASALKIYPNPTRDNISLEYDLKKASQVSISLVDLQGRVLLSKKEEQPAGKLERQLSLDHEKILAGLYFLRIQLADQVYSEKVWILD
ncbi:MAG: C25 family cysteine peptidase [Bacteroidota bacterium]